MTRQHIGVALAGVISSLGIPSAAAQPAAPAAMSMQADSATSSIDQQIASEVRLGERLWRSACPIAESDGLCVSATPLADKGPARCEGPRQIALMVPRARQAARAQEAMEHLNKALALYHSGDAVKLIPEGGDAAARQQRIAAMQDQVATAMLLQADQSFEQLLGTQIPTGLVFDPHRTNENRASIARFKAWLEQKSKELGEAQKLYQAVLQLKQPASTVAAAGRIGQLFQAFAEDLYNAHVPVPPPAPASMAQDEWMELFRDAYCDQMSDTAQPLAGKAAESFKLCLERAATYNVSGPLYQRCEAALLVLGLPLPAVAPALSPVPETAGFLSQELIRDAVRPHLHEVKACAETMGLVSSAQGGQVTARWKITAAGSVDSVSLESSTLKDPGTEQCILSLIKSWTFPLPQGGFVQTSYPFELRIARPDPAPPTDTAEVRGSLSKELIRYGIRAHIGEVKTCFEQGALTRNREGRIMVRFLIAGTGAVAAATTQSSTVQDPETEQCIVNALKTWTFPKPQGGVVMVSYPFVLKAVAD